MLGWDAQNFSGKSMRLGGLSMAINARVPEPILYLQSRHGKAKAARCYMIPDDPPILTTLGGQSWRPEAVICVANFRYQRTCRTGWQPSVTRAGV